MPEHHHLPPELWQKILTRLPSRSLLRFRCVCKNWCSLIDSHTFISMHLNHYRNNSAKTQLCIIQRVPKSMCDIIFTICRSDTVKKIAQFVDKSETYRAYTNYMIDGLMLVDIFNYSIVNSDELCLWNPSIRKSWILPHCPIKCRYPYSRCFLGFSPSSKDYKVVVFEVSNVVDYEMTIAIYSFHDHLWSVINNKLKVPNWCFQIVQHGCGAVFYQGALYWVPDYIMWLGDNTKLVSFNFDAKEFSYLKLPNIDEEMYKVLFLFGESLAFFCISNVRSCIWVMEKGARNELWRQCWERDTNVEFYELFRECPLKGYQLLYIEDTSTLLVQCSKKLVAYDIRSNQVRYLRKCHPLSYVQIYVESLVLHKGSEGVALNSNV